MDDTTDHLDRLPPQDLDAETPLIADPLLEGSIRQLVILASLSADTFLPPGPDDVQLLDGLRDTAAEVRDRLNRDGEAV